MGAASAQAQPFDAPPPVGAPRPVTIASPVSRTLPNGLRVVVAQRAGLPLVTVELLVRSGSETDPDRKAGLANLTATLLSKGTRRLTAPQIAQTAEALGGQLATGAGWHHSFVAITVMRNQVAAALDLLADVTMNPTFASSEVERARRNAVDALNVAMAQPAALAGMTTGRVVFGDGTYGHRPDGTPTSLARIRRDDVAQLHGSIYRPDNATLIFAGDIDPQQAQDLAAASFGRWVRPAQPLAFPPYAQGHLRESALVVLDMPGAGQAGVIVAARGVARAAPDYYAGVVVNALLGGGYSSRLNQEIRIRRGLSYGAGSSLDARRSGGLFAASAQTANATAPEVLRLMLREIAAAGDTPAEPTELDARKASLIGEYSRSLETTGGLAAQIAGLETDGVDPAEVTQVTARVSGVEPAAAQNFARTHLRAANISVIVAGDAAQFGDALRAEHPDVRTIDAKRLDLDDQALVKPAPK
jgi:zinc protease